MTIRLRLPRTTACVICLAALLTILACDQASDDHRGQSPDIRNLPWGDPNAPLEFDDVFEVMGEIVLDESGADINVAPVLRIDPRGGFLIADGPEGRVRRYSTEGELLWSFGRLGEGPEEFQHPTVAVRIGGPEILVVDTRLRAVVWDEDANAIVRWMPYALRAVDDADVLGDGRVLYSARTIPDAPDHGRHALHVIDPADGTTDASFFAPPIHENDRMLATAAGATRSFVRNDTITSAWALSDTVYRFDGAGESLDQIPIPSSLTTNFARQISDGLSVALRPFVTDVFRTTSDLNIAQLARFPQNIAEWHVVAFDDDGRKYFEINDGPRLLAVDDQDTFFFAHPEAVTSEHMVRARIRVRE